MEPWQVNEIHAGVQGEGRQAVDRVARLVFVGDQGDRTGRQGSGGRAGDAAPLAQQDGRHGRGGDQAVGRRRDGGVEEFAGRGRAIEAGERDIDDGVGFFSRHGSTRHGVDGRLHRRIQGPFQGRADPQGAGRFAGLRVHHAARLPHVQIQARQPHGRQARGAGPRHPRDPCRFLHGRVRAPQDARPVVGAGLGSGRDRPRPGDERHAGIGNPRRAPRQDARHHQTGEGHGRQARPRGTQVRGGGAEPAARGRHHLRAHGQRLVRPHGVRRRRVRPQDRRMGVRHHHGHRGAAAAGAGTGDIMGRLAWRHGRSRAPFRPWRAVHQPRVHHQGRGIRHASLDRHGRRLVRQRHGRERRRRVQDRARLATQALPGFEGPGIGDVPVGLVEELEASAPVLGLQDTGTDRNRVLCKPSGANRPTIRAEQKSGHIIQAQDFIEEPHQATRHPKKQANS